MTDSHTCITDSASAGGAGTKRQQSCYEETPGTGRDKSHTHRPPDSLITPAQKAGDSRMKFKSGAGLKRKLVGPFPSVDEFEVERRGNQIGFPSAVTLISA